MTVPLARIINKEPFDMKAWIPIILAAIGIVIIFNPFGDAASTTQVTSRHIIGVAIGLLGALCLALFNVLATRSVKKYGKEVTNSFSFLYGTILMYIFMIIFGVPVFKHLVPVLSSVQTSILGVAGLGQAQIHNIGAFITAHNHDVYRNYVILLFIAVIVKFFGFLFFVGAMKEVGAINATSVFYIKPILVPIFAFLILGTVIQPTTIIGIAVIVVAAVLLYFIKRSTAKRLQAQNGNNSH
ncbi:MAG: DMT family transporter, partial [Psittacicella sp.]